MDKRKLLEYRFKVIADYPHSKWAVGQTVVLSTTKFGEPVYEWAEHDGMHSEGVLFFTEYPQIFRPMEWHEERTIEDLPDYVKYQKNIYKAYWKCEVSVRCEKHPSDGIGLDADWGSCLPATEAEYLSILAQLETVKGSS
jgi:hypothetical protein